MEMETGVVLERVGNMLSVLDNESPDYIGDNEDFDESLQAIANISQPLLLWTIASELREIRLALENLNRETEEETEPKAPTGEQKQRRFRPLN